MSEDTPTPPRYPRLESRKLRELKPHPDGVREADNDALYWLGKSLESFSLLQLPVLNARTGNLIDGDKVVERLRALRSPEWECPVWCVDIDEEMEDVAHLALNNHAGEWRWQAVGEQLKALKGRKVPMGLTGFHESDFGPLTEADWTPPAKGPLDGSGDDGRQGGLF